MGNLEFQLQSSEALPMSYIHQDVHEAGPFVGEIYEGSDGQLYEWVEGVDGLGNPKKFGKN